jgi:hypothetical protein
MQYFTILEIHVVKYSMGLIQPYDFIKRYA